jgi:acyl-CoA hydrolase
MEGKKVSDSQSQMTQIVFPNDTNSDGNLYGGQLLYWIDSLGGIVAKRHSRSTVVTASIDSLSFLNPIRHRDIVMLEAWINYVGRTSMEIEVRVVSENPFSGETKKTCRAFLTFVAVDDKGTPRHVPPLITETKEEKDRYYLAKKRREERLKDRELQATLW